jgi:ATP-dependent exoDNAse (exonuclease V) alpha subunit
MSLYHLSVKVIGRSSGRSATSAAAYRAAEKIVDQRTGLIHDFTRKRGVEHTELLLPGGLPAYRAEFWNAVELHHKRGDAVLSREVEVALPDELTAAQRRALAIEFARELVERYGVAADVAIHAPSREGDERNHHAHIMLSACTVGTDGALGKKAAALDPIFCQKHRLPNMADHERGRWAELTNLALERAGHAVRIDHRSLQAQGIDRVPSSHMGPAVAGMARRGVSSAVSLRVEAEVHDRLERARAVGESERQAVQIDRAIIDTSGDLAAAVRDRDIAQRLQGSARAGIDAFRAQADQRREAEIRKRQALQAFLDFKADQERKKPVQRSESEVRAKEPARQRDAPKESPAPERPKPRGPSVDR